MKKLNYKIIAGFVGLLAMIGFGFFLIKKNDDTTKSSNKNVYQKYTYTKEDLKILTKQKSLVSAKTEASCGMPFSINIENMTANADLVLIVRPKQHFLEATHFSTEETGSDGVKYISSNRYTIWNMDIKKIIKGEDIIKKGNFKIAQYGVWIPDEAKAKLIKNPDNFDTQKYYYSSALQQTIFQKGRDYLVILKRGLIQDDVYFILGCNGEGKINLDGEDLEEQEFNNGYIMQFKKDAITKYKKEIDSLGIPVKFGIEAEKEKNKDSEITLPSTSEATLSSPETN